MCHTHHLQTASQARRMFNTEVDGELTREATNFTLMLLGVKNILILLRNENLAVLILERDKVNSIRI